MAPFAAQAIELGHTNSPKLRTQRVVAIEHRCIECRSKQIAGCTTLGQIGLGGGYRCVPSIRCSLDLRAQIVVCLGVRVELGLVGGN